LLYFGFRICLFGTYLVLHNVCNSFLSTSIVCWSSFLSICHIISFSSYIIQLLGFSVLNGSLAANSKSRLFELVNFALFPVGTQHYSLSL
jgi:hypothetical protein